MKTFVHIGAPKAASSSLQHFFHENNKINFLGIIRDHDENKFSKIYSGDFHQYCRHKNNLIGKAKKIKKKLSKKKINIISDEDFFTSLFADFRKKIERIIKIFPKCEFIVVLRDPSETLISWHNFYIRGNKNTPLSLEEYVNDKKTKLFVDLISYEKRINYFKSLKKNKFHIIDFNLVKEGKILNVLEKIFHTEIYTQKKNNILHHKNNSPYFFKKLFKKIPFLRSVKFYIPRFFLYHIKIFLFNFEYIKYYKDESNKSELKYLDKLFAKEKKYYKSLFKKKGYITLN